MHTNLKVQNLIEKEGAEGYAVWNLCLEMVGKEGKVGRIEGQKRWKKGLLKVFQWSDEGKLEKILNSLAEVRLINPKALNYGNLHIPEFKKRMSDWARRQLSSNSEVTSEKITVDKNRIDKIILEYIREKGWSQEPKILSSIYKRNCKQAKALFLLTDRNLERTLDCLRWVNASCRNKGLTWTLETVENWYPEYNKKYPIEDKTPQQFKELIKDIGK